MKIGANRPEIKAKSFSGGSKDARFRVDAGQLCLGSRGFNRYEQRIGINQVGLTP